MADVLTHEDEDRRQVLSPGLRLGVLTVAVASAGAALYASSVHSVGELAGSDHTIPLWGLLVAFAVAELLTVNLETGKEAHALTFAEIPMVVGLYLAAPADLVVARLVAAAVVLGVVRRQQLTKLVFNLAHFLLEATLAIAIFRVLLGSGDPSEPSHWYAAIVTLAVTHVIGTIVVSMAITAVEGWPGIDALRQILGVGLVTCIANACGGIVVGASFWASSYSGLLILVVAAALFAVHHRYNRLFHRHKNLEVLHDFTRGLGGSLEIRELEQAVAEGALDIMRAEHAALLLPPARTDTPATRLVTSGGEHRRSNVSPIELAADLAILLPDDVARLYEPGQPLPGWLAEIGIKDAAIVPLTSAGIVSGALVVANRLTTVATFVEDDLRVFETLASHANVALQNGRLVAHLQHEAEEQAYLAKHDLVTGLPNRSSLEDGLERAIRQAKATEMGVALLFVDLETFKEVNDTLGTATADRLLGDVRHRLQGVLPDGATLVRFAGDQFGVLVESVSGIDEVVELADTIRAQFQSPFTADAVSLALGASIGIAAYPEHANSAELLIQRADAATYHARLEGSGIEVYAADNDPYAPRRLALAADLREAIEAGEVDVYVQPKVSLADRTVVAAEALVRWTHPRLGPLRPDQFIPAAEHTGVIRPLTMYVIREALQQARDWRDAGYDLTVAVNLSARNLFDSHLVEDIAAVIADVGVPSEMLTLELTESTVMGTRSLAVLEGLQALGVELSVDDFGTGYSSLSHLRQLPVSELKVDKSFVMSMTTNEHDAVIVRSLIDLGRSLGLRTVAEGVESTEAWDLLVEFGCDQAQGYLLSRPLPSTQFTTWLSRQEVRQVQAADSVVLLNRERERRLGGNEA